VEQILLKMSSTNIPYLEFPNMGFISFVNHSKTNKGYTQLNFSFRENGQNTSFLTDMKLKRINGSKNGDMKSLHLSKTMKALEKIFEKFVVDTVFPFDNVEKLGKMINSITYEKFEKVAVPLKRKKKLKLENEVELEKNSPEIKNSKQKVTRKTSKKSKPKKAKRK
jgi:hypothetical protein